jgi:sugar phosphate isomerase/epimerase
MRRLPRLLVVLSAVLLVSPPPGARSADKPGIANEGGASRPTSDVFARDNLVAWCIVPFDAKHRGPKERADMLVRLGIRRVAYDWRDQHIPEWDEELEQYKSHGIDLVGFWAPDRHQQILDLLKRHGLKAQLWVMGGEPKGDSQDAKVETEASRIGAVAKLAGQYGCTVGLYNHGGWFGEPENQIAIIERLRQDGVTNVGIVYNLHHGHEHVVRFPAMLKLMKPYLMCLTINGMKKGGPEVLPVGQGGDDLSLLKAIKGSGYSGPIAILNHREQIDAEEGLRQNIEGLTKLLRDMPDEQALKTYGP